MKYSKYILIITAFFIFAPTSEASNVYEWPYEKTHIGFYEKLMASSKTPVQATILLDLNNKRGYCDGIDTLGATTNLYYYTDSANTDSLTPYTDKFFVCLANQNWNKYVSKRLVFMHEVGHIHAAVTNYSGHYNMFYKLMRDSKDWQPINVVNIDEYYADAFAWCSIGAPFAWKRGKKYNEKYSFVYWPTKKEHKKVCDNVFGL